MSIDSAMIQRSFIPEAFTNSAHAVILGVAAPGTFLL